LVAVVLWLVAAYALWTPLSAAFSAAIAGWITTSGPVTDPGWVARAGGGIAAFALLTLAVGALALAAVAVFAGPVFVRVVEARHFRRSSASTADIAGGAANALVAIALWLPLWLIVLPFLLVPVVGVPLVAGECMAQPAAVQVRCPRRARECGRAGRAVPRRAGA
jgi:hypothetical protein